MLAVFDGAHHYVFCYGVATNQFDHDIDIRIADDVGNIFCRLNRADFHRRVWMTHGNLLDNNVPTGTACNIFRIISQYIKCTTAYCT